MQNGLVFNIQKYSLHDGPGIRTTVFLKGCPLHCPWCHNPEGISRRREIVVLESRCLGCGQCRLACRYGAIIPGESSPKRGFTHWTPEPPHPPGGHPLPLRGGEGKGEGVVRGVEVHGEGALPPRSEVCELCGACVEACPTQARQMIGQEMSVSGVLKAVLQDRVFYEDSGGGVTFSGGEPLSQIDFLRELLEACRHHGLHTAVDTCGLARLEDVLAVAVLTDLFLYDLKFMDDAKHRRYTGVSNALILDNLQALGRVHGRIWLRVPVIPGINDDEAGLEAAARFAAAVPGVQQVNLLPFHRTGLPKTRRLGRDSGLAEVQPPSPEAMKRALEIFAGAGLAVRTGG